MVRLLHLRRAWHNPVENLFPDRQCHAGNAAVLAGLCSGLRLSSAGCDPVRFSRRQAGPEIHVPGHSDADGHCHRWHRNGSFGPEHRHGCAGHRHSAAHLAGAGAGRRIWRCGDICLRAFPTQQARALHRLYSGKRGRWLRPKPRCGPGLQGGDGRRELAGMGLASAVPPVDTAAGGLAVDAAQAQ